MDILDLELTENEDMSLENREEMKIIRKVLDGDNVWSQEERT